MDDKVVNLQKRWSDGPGIGLRVTLETGTTVTHDTGQLNHGKLICRVEQPTLTRTGRDGKPERLFSLIGANDATPATMLRMVADLYDQGDIKLA